MGDISMRPEYNTRLFCQIWSSVSDFVNDYIPVDLQGMAKPITDDNAKLLYYLLYANYGNNPIVNRSEDQFKLKVFKIIFQYGPTWEKRLDIQKTLRTLSEDQLLQGSKQIYNHSYNPSTEPSTATLDELTTINDQNVNKNKKGILDGYSFLWDLLKVDVTKEFIDKFKELFKIFVDPDCRLYFVEEDEEDDN